MFDPTKPADNSPLDAGEMRNQLNGLKALIDLVLPVGCVTGYLKSLPSVPALPGTWVECNGQPINDAESPLNGLNAPDLNGAGGPQRFLRGAATSGGTGGADAHVHDIDLQGNISGTADGGDHSSVNPTVYSTTAPNPASSSLPSYYEVVWVLRVK